MIYRIFPSTTHWSNLASSLTFWIFINLETKSKKRDHHQMRSWNLDPENSTVKIEFDRFGFSSQKWHWVTTYTEWTLGVENDSLTKNGSFEMWKINGSLSQLFLAIYKAPCVTELSNEGAWQNLLMCTENKKSTKNSINKVEWLCSFETILWLINNDS